MLASAPHRGLPGLLELLLSVGLLAVPAARASTGPTPIPVSPGRPSAEVVIATPCPVFSWAAETEIGTFELVVLESRGDGVTETEPRMRTLVPGTARSFSPAAADCLSPGGRYAWKLRRVGASGTEGWSPSHVFRVRPAPGTALVEAVLQQVAAVSSHRFDPSLSAARRTEPSPPADTASPKIVLDPGPPRAAPDPATDPISLFLADSLRLGTAGQLFKDQRLLAWNDNADNTAVGRDALGSVTSGEGNTALGSAALAADTEGSFNTAIGFAALQSNTTGDSNTAVGDHALGATTAADESTAVGARALETGDGGANNTAVGYEALRFGGAGGSNTVLGARAAWGGDDGGQNTAIGDSALFANESGSRNTAVGVDALDSTTGSDNIALGSGAGEAIGAGSHNIAIGHPGDALDSATIRIGSGHLATFIAGIHDNVEIGATVLVTAAGKLGTSVSSRRYKRDIRDLAHVGVSIQNLRPVVFRYRERPRTGDDQSLLQVGLIAEEVAQTHPELVVLGSDGRYAGVRYHLLPSLLLIEVQRMARDLAARREALEEVERLLGRLSAVADRLDDGP